MKKNTEERYKSAYGLKEDLKRCYDELKWSGTISLFTPGENDFFDRFHTPQKIYSREKEIGTIQQCLKQVANGELILLEVTGYSGIGKSSLVMEAMKPVIQGQGRFARYKFDQFNKNIPNDAIATIIKTFTHQMLAQPNEILSEWRYVILDAVGKNGQILIDLVPDIKLIIGEQPPLETLSPLESEHRFNYVLYEFIKSLPRPSNPLILLFDDFQWADESSLKLFKYLLTSSTIKNLLLIIVYRDNEVTAIHPLSHLLKELSNTGLNITHLSIAALEESGVKEIINEIFYPLSKTDLKYLSQLVEGKTHGNPFFVIQFLKYLYDKEFIKFNSRALQWSVDIDGASNLSISDNVIDFLLEKVKTIDLELLEFMKKCSIFGNRFHRTHIVDFYHKNYFFVEEMLKNALQEEFIIQVLSNDISGSGLIYQFSHDRIQQVFYGLLDPFEKPKLHYELGRSLLTILSDRSLDELIMSVVNHLNFGLNLPISEKEKLEILKLNYRAELKQKMHKLYCRQSSILKMD